LSLRTSRVSVPELPVSFAVATGAAFGQALAACVSCGRGIPFRAGELLEEIVDLEVVRAIRRGLLDLPAVLDAGEADGLVFAGEVDAADGGGVDREQALVAEIGEAFVEAGLEVRRGSEEARITGEGDVGGIAGGRVVAEEQAACLVVFGGHVELEGRVGEAELGEVGRLVFNEALGGEGRERGEHGRDDAAVGGEGFGRGDLPVRRAGADEGDGLRAALLQGEGGDGGGIELEDRRAGRGGGRGGLGRLAVFGPIENAGEDEKNDDSNEETAKFHRAFPEMARAGSGAKALCYWCLFGTTKVVP
jgi:hypothetical protein